MPNVGRQAKGKHTQSVVFEKAAGWTEAASRAWCKDHGYFTDGHDESNTQHRWRQYDDNKKQFRYRADIIEKKDGKTSIMLILGFPMGSTAKSEQEEENMSFATEFNELKAAKVTMEAEIASLKSEKTTLAAQLTEANTALAAAKDVIASREKAMEDMRAKADADATAAKTALDEATAKANEAQEKQKATFEAASKEIADLKSKLALPQYQDANAAGMPVGAVSGDNGKDVPAADMYARYLACAMGEERTRFWTANETAIRAAMRERAKAEVAKV